MEQKASVAGRAACKVVRMAASIPIFGKQLQNGTLRRKLQGKEPQWKCPEHLKLQVIARKRFTMEYLTVKEVEKSKGVILQLHGGGYCGAMRNKYRNFAAMYQEVSNGLSVLTVDYRVAPENPFPAALEDAYESFQWLLEQGYLPKQIFVVGDSAGGGLALSLIHYLKDRKEELPGGVVTMSAWTDLTKSGESYQENFMIDPLFGRRKETLIYCEDYYQGQDPAIPYISPLMGDFTGFPPMLMQVGEYEMLLSDTKAVAKKAKEQGVWVKEHVYKGMFHVFQMGELMYPESRQAWVEVGRFLRKWQRQTV